jgi:long-chain acyl-CoA synthetase
MVVSGFNVYPAEIESVMLKHPNVLECVAIGIPSPTRGEEPKIFVVAKTPELTEKELIAFGKAHLTGYKRPRHVAFVDSLPKSSLGKVLRKELRKREGLE